MIPHGFVPTRIGLPTALFCFGSTTVTVLEPKFATQRRPFAAATAHGCLPTAIFATTCGSDEVEAAAAVTKTAATRIIRARRSMMAASRSSDPTAVGWY